MWLAETVIGGSSDNLYTVLASCAGVLATLAGALRVRDWRRHRDDVEPEPDPEPIIHSVVEGVEPLLKRQIRGLERAIVQLEREKAAQQVRIEEFIQQLATCQAQRQSVELQFRSEMQHATDLQQRVDSLKREIGELKKQLDGGRDG